MKRVSLAAVALLVAVALSAQTAAAHPGGTDSSGGHTCRTNCPSWGYSTGQYHYHGGGYTPPPPTDPWSPNWTTTTVPARSDDAELGDVLSSVVLGGLVLAVPAVVGYAVGVQSERARGGTADKMTLAADYRASEATHLESQTEEER